MKKRTLALLAVISLLTACASNTQINDQVAYDSKEQARIRLYGQNGHPTIMQYTENGKKVKINVGGGMGEAFGSLLGVTNNQSIGMPQTQISNELHKKNGVLSKAFYKEFTIPANTSIQIQNSLISMTTTDTYAKTVSYSPKCQSKLVPFTAQAGKDYEVASIINNQGCAVIIFEIAQDGTLTPIK